MTTKKNKNEMTEKEAIKKVLEYRAMAEYNAICILYKDPQLIHLHETLTIDTFLNNKCKVYFAILEGIVKKERKVLDEIQVNLYLEKHPKLSEKFAEIGGWAISETFDYVDVNSLDGYLDEINKWNCVMNLCKSGFGIAKKLRDFVDCSSEEIYSYYEVMVNNIFLNTSSSKDVIHRLGDSIDSIIDSFDEGEALGMEIVDMPLLNAEIGGWSKGLTEIGGTSGTGKSTFTRSVFVRSCLENREPVLMICNEEGYKKFISEMLILVSNVVYGKSIQKYVLRNGGFSPEFKRWLKEVPAKYLKEHAEDIVIVNMDSFSADKSIKLIKKYNSLYGIENVIIDTFKSDFDDTSGQTWKTMSDSMRRIFDCVKEDGGLGCRCLCTFQLNKSSTKQRCYTQDNVGEAKAIVDCASTVLMIRNILPDEYSSGKNELKVWMPSGKNGLTKTPITLDPNKRYQLIFLIKNRNGSANQHSIVMEADLSRNIYKEIGLTIVNPDW